MKFLARAFVLAYCLISRSPCEEWSKIGGLTNASSYLLIAPDRHALHVANFDGIFTTRDGGGSWGFSQGDLRWSDQYARVSVDALTAVDTVLFASVMYAGIQRSFDGGGSWEQIHTKRTDRPFVVSRGKLYFAGFDSIFATPIARKEWNPASPRFPSQIREFAVLDSCILAIGHTGRLYRHRTGDSGWGETGFDSALGRVVALAAQGNSAFLGTESGLFLSSDRGDSWQPLWRESHRFESVATILAGGGLLAASISSKGILIYARRQEGWVQTGQLLDRTALAITDSTLYVHNGEGGSGAGVVIYRRAGDAFDWSFPDTVDCRQILHHRTRITSVLAIGSNVVVGASNGTQDDAGVLFSSDLGRTWSRSSGSIANFHVERLVPFGGRIFAATDGGLFLSEDHGRSWSLVDLGRDVGKVLLLDTCGQQLHFATGERFFTSIDGGSRWTSAALPLESEQALSVSHHGARIHVRYWNLATGSRDYLSMDGGLAWDTLPGVGVGSVQLLSSGTFLISPALGLLRLRGDGRSWDPFNAGIADSLGTTSVFALGSRTFAATSIQRTDASGWRTTQGDLYTLIDDGTRWERAKLSKPALAGVHGIGRAGPFLLVSASSAGTYRETFLSADTGRTWLSILGSLSANDLAVVGDELFLASSDGLWKRPLPAGIPVVAVEPPAGRSGRPGQLEVVHRRTALHVTLHAGLPIPVLCISDIAGREVSLRRPASVSPDGRTSVFPLDNLPRGLYVYRIRAGSEIEKAGIVPVR